MNDKIHFFGETMPDIDDDSERTNTTNHTHSTTNHQPGEVKI